MLLDLLKNRHINGTMVFRFLLPCSIFYVITFTSTDQTTKFFFNTRQRMPNCTCISPSNSHILIKNLKILPETLRVDNHVTRSTVSQCCSYIVRIKLTMPFLTMSVMFDRNSHDVASLIRDKSILRST